LPHFAAVPALPLRAPAELPRLALGQALREDGRLKCMKKLKKFLPFEKPSAKLARLDGQHAR
jgi:hypothetical protein